MNKAFEHHRQIHDQTLSAYERPVWLLATKTSIDSDQIFEGAEANLRHNYWILQTEDPNHVRGSSRPIDFNQPMGPQGLMLSSPSLENDLLSAKIIVIEALKGIYIRSITSSKAASELVRYFFWIVRWRNALEVSEMKHINPSLFEDFCNKLAKGGVAALVDLDTQILRLEKRLIEGEWSWPLYQTKTEWRIDFDGVGRELGVSLQALRQGEIQRKIRSLIEATAPNHVSRQFRAEKGADADVRGLTLGTVSHILNAWKVLYEASHMGLLSDRLTFDPFNQVSSSARLKQISRPPNHDHGEGKDGSKRTGTPGPENWLRLLDGAARWVLDYARPIMTICEQARNVHADVFNTKTVNTVRQKRFMQAVDRIISDNLPIDRPRLPPIIPKWNRAGKGELEDIGITLDEALTYVAVACIITIGGFSARRRGELDSLKADCIRKDPSSGEWVLTSYIEKTIRDDAEIPVPAIVALSVGILEDLSASARERDGTKWLSRIHRPSLTSQRIDEMQKSYLDTNLSANINIFADIVGARQTLSGSAWDFKPHQLRRAFSIYYYWGYRYNKLDALSRFLRHYDPEMTRRYVTDVLSGKLMRLRETVEARTEVYEENDRLMMEAQAAIKSLTEISREHESVRRDYFIERNLEIFDGHEAPIGFGAASLRNELDELVEQARRKIRIGGTSNGGPDQERAALIALLRQHSPSKYMEPNPGKYAHCGCRPHANEDLTKAVCLQRKEMETGRADSVRADYEFSTVDGCYSCPHCIAFSENIAFMNGKVEEAQQTAQAQIEEFRVAAQARLEELKKNLENARSAVSKWSK